MNNEKEKKISSKHTNCVQQVPGSMKKKQDKKKITAKHHLIDTLSLEIDIDEFLINLFDPIIIITKNHTNFWLIEYSGIDTIDI